MFTAGSAWNVDMAPEERRGRMIGLYGLAIWTGLTLGPPIGVLLQHAGGFHLVWAFAAGAPLLGAAIASRLPEDLRRTARTSTAGRSSPARRSGQAGPLRSASSGSPPFPRSSSSAWTSAGSGMARRSSASSPRRWSRPGWSPGGLPDRIGAARCAVGAALIETVGLILLGAAQDLAVVIVGAIGMGAAFSLLFPSLSLVAINRVGPERRGVAMGTFTASFDLGMLVGSPLVGARGCDRRLQRSLLRGGGRGPRLRRLSLSMSRAPAVERPAFADIA